MTEMSERIDLAADADDVVVVEASYDVDDGAALRECWQGTVLPRPAPSAAPLTRPAMSTNSTVVGTVLLGGADIGGERLEALVGDGDDAAVGLDGAERVVAASAVPFSTSALKRVDLPTLGRPMPVLSAIEVTAAALTALRARAAVSWNALPVNPLERRGESRRRRCATNLAACMAMTDIVWDGRLEPCMRAGV